MDAIPDNKTLTGTWKNGRILLDWPEGCRVIVTPGWASEVHGMTEEDQSDDPEAIAGGRVRRDPALADEPRRRSRMAGLHGRQIHDAG